MDAVVEPPFGVWSKEELSAMLKRVGHSPVLTPTFWGALAKALAIGKTAEQCRMAYVAATAPPAGAPPSPCSLDSLAGWWEAKFYESERRVAACAAACEERVAAAEAAAEARVAAAKQAYSQKLAKARDRIVQLEAETR